MKLNPSKLMKDQLTQVFEYAEIMCRLNQAQELLNPKGGYIGESKVNDGITQLKNEVYENFKKHFVNTKVSEQALQLLDEFKSILIQERLECKYKIGDEIKDYFGVYEVIQILENEYADEDDEKLLYLCRYYGHDGIRYSLRTEQALNECQRR